MLTLQWYYLCLFRFVLGKDICFELKAKDPWVSRTEKMSIELTDPKQMMLPSLNSAVGDRCVPRFHIQVGI